MHSMSTQVLTLPTAVLPTEIGTSDHLNQRALPPTTTLQTVKNKTTKKTHHPTAAPSIAAITLIGIMPQQTPPVLLNQLLIDNRIGITSSGRIGGV